MITDRKTAAQRQYESFLSAVREFGCNSNEGQFERTLAGLVAAHRETKATDMQPGCGGCEHDDYHQGSLSLNDQMDYRGSNVPYAR
jgi:hypothetical protein